MNAEHLMMILRDVHTSEKTTTMAERFNQYTFKVLAVATKLQIKKAVEDMFKVKVKAVSVLNVKGKKKRFKQLEGKRKDWKKAFVTLHDGYNIDLTMAE